MNSINDIRIKLAIWKFDIIKKIINKKQMSIGEQTILKETLILINKLTNTLKNNQNIDCLNKFEQIENKMTKII